MQEVTPSPEVIKALYTDPNPSNNSTIHDAKAMLVLMAGWEMPYDTIVAQSEVSAGSAPVISLEQVVASGLPQTTALNFFGRSLLPTVKPSDIDDDEPEIAPRGRNIALDIALKNNTTDAMNWFMKLYNEYHPGTTQAQAALAADQLSVVKAQVNATMDQLVTKAFAY